jgi:hypothetical protein
MKKFLVIVIALAAAGGSAYYLFEKGMNYTLPTNGAMSSSASSEMQDMFDTLSQSSSSSEDTLLMDAGLASSSPSSASRRITTLTAGAYADYKDGVIGNGEESALFFHDKTSTASKATDTAIKAMVKAGTAAVTIYRVDIDGFASLKATYDVKVGNTVVRVNAKGTAVSSVTSPSQTDLETLLK